MVQTRAEKTRKYLQLIFQDYYRTNHDKVDIPLDLHTREFGIERWDFTWRCSGEIETDDEGNQSKGCGRSGETFRRPKECPICGSKRVQVNNWSRHIGYRTKDDLLNDLVISVPHSIYHSAAFYRVPVARNMKEKDWQGAELVFDIDADHLDSRCTLEHDSWRCENSECGKEGRGKSPEQCPSCGQSTFQTLKWLCDRCLNDAKRNTIKLYDKFLTGDFGISPEAIQINYSGHRGYHIRIRDPKVFRLDSNGRMGVAHYLTGFGLHSSITAEGQLRVIPSGDLQNWQLPSISRKIADAIIEFIVNIDDYNGTERWVRLLQDHKDEAVYGLQMSPPRLSGKVKGIGAKSWQEIANRAASFQGVEIDQPVTTDIHRVIRLVGSLNGKTGFSVNNLTRDELDSFDPFSDAVAFRQGGLKVSISSRFDVPLFRIGDTDFGSYSNGTVQELPMPAAVFLLCKGMARIE